MDENPNPLEFEDVPLVGIHAVKASRVMDTYSDAENTRGLANLSGISNTQNEGPSLNQPSKLPPKLIRIQRDYSRGDGITRYVDDIPYSLRGKVSIDDFRATIRQLNVLFEEAQSLSSTWLDNVLEILTIYLWTAFVKTRAQKAMDKVYAYIAEQNKKVYHPAGLHISDPATCAFLYLEIEVL
ncbi:hypothetical protein BZG36_00667 [Bifiguratus adelaidae]|uniref:Ras modification protein ERF4 n=1 Tax=Bifiguratus adelaidae TaxID=1938954 RepID=A0A261Y744_9FUNG|nr:hypothetical protein BZG36_00667 [Bifiguratus adelaidae]